MEKQRSQLGTLKQLGSAAGQCFEASHYCVAPGDGLRASEAQAECVALRHLFLHILQVLQRANAIHGAS